ncbi:hypothetical protein V1504DRAFT_471948 [Lipomyces starkeyi]
MATHSQPLLVAAIATIRRSDQVPPEPVSAETLQNLYTMDSRTSSAPMPAGDSNISWHSEQDDCPTLLQDSFQPLDHAELLPSDIDKESLIEEVEYWNVLPRLHYAHGIRKIFARALRDAILHVDADDQERLTTYLLQIGTAWEERLRTNPKWIWACETVNS